MNMFTLIKQTFLSFAATLLVCLPAWADDTEIYFGGNNTTTVRPNVLFILDTSSSMGETDGGSITRLDRMKDALVNVLSSADDINVGLMRFTNPGGPVLYPVRYINESTTATSIELTGSVSQRISSNNDDAKENSSGDVYASTEQLETIADGSRALNQYIRSGLDDAEERVSNGNVNIDSSDLEFMHDGGDQQMIGIRMRSINVPKGATITNAYLELEVDEQHDGDLTINIYGEDTNNANWYSDSNRNISSRKKTSAKVEWSVSTEYPVDTRVQTPDIKSIVQEIVNRGGWSAQNAMAFIFELKTRSGSAKRVFESYDGQRYATKLHIEYEDGSTANTPQTLGLRFNNISVPQGATITGASLSVKAAEYENESASVTIWGEDTGHSEQYLESANNISSRTKTTASVGWTGIGTWQHNSTYSSPNLSAIVQEIVDRSDWCGGNSLALMIDSATGKRALGAYEYDKASAPLLNITYDVDSVADGACNNVPITANIQSNNDDAEQDGSTMQLGSDDLDLGEKKVGLRYTDLPLKKDATLANAYLEFSAEAPGSDTTTLTIYGHDVATAPEFTTASNNIGSRTKTSTSVSWTPTLWSNTGGVYRSPNIAPIINEILANTSWAPGNDLAFIIEGSGSRAAKSADGSATPPRLVYYANEADVTSMGDTVREELIAAVDTLPSSGYTPIVDTLYEAALYYRGEAVDYGKNRGDSGWEQRYTRVTHEDAYTGGSLVQPSGCSADNLDDPDCADEYISGDPVYTSPITESCQRNYIVLLTDGDANSNHSEEKIKTMTGADSCESASSGERCGLDLIKYLYDNDQSSSLAGTQNIEMHTIGLEFSTDWLSDLASAGDGKFYVAESTEDLSDTFDTLIRTMLAANSTFVEPSVTINQFNRFAHRDDVYFALFKPQESTKWFGNVKKYQLKGNPATLYDNHSPQQPAIDPDSGFFAIDSKSFWSEDEDGNQVEKGGAAHKLPASRKVYSDLVSGSALNIEDNIVADTNTNLTKALLNIEAEDDAYRAELIDWMLGLDENDALRYEMGDPLHSRPELVTYDGFSDPLEGILFFGTNEGYLHAIDIETGIEKFAFIPQELLANLNDYYENLPSDPSTNPRPYGLDGGLTVWTRDVNGDGDLKDSGDFARIYVGMRRGGRNYYALDVTDLDNPEIMWKIKGGTDVGFEDLGQTWSEPVKSRVNFDGTVYDVLIFAGGYDEDQDDVSVRTIDDRGNAIFMVDAVTGNLLWSGGNHNGHDEIFSAMNYSIPSDITVLDMNRDGFADQMYVGDMGGQVWRFDINNESTQLQHFVDGGVIAELADDTPAGNRRFYYKPDVALAVESDGRYLSVGIGSGFRAHPLDSAIEDRFHMIKLFDTHGNPGGYTTYSSSDLYDITDNQIMSDDPDLLAEAQEALSNTAENRKHGWMIRLTNSGEKVLASSATIQNQIIFTTYEPSPPDTNSCNPAQGTTRAYLVSLFDGSPMTDIDGDGDVDKGDRVIQLQIGSIPSTPTVIDTVDSKPTVWVGPERLDQVNTDVESIRTYWIEDSSQ